MRQLGATLIVVLLLALTGCELVADFDRGLIPEPPPDGGAPDGAAPDGAITPGPDAAPASDSDAGDDNDAGR